MEVSEPSASPAYADVVAAARLIAGHVHRTPVATSRRFDEELGARLFFKCENLQKVGAFKARGATHAVLRLDDAIARCGVITHSSGNHGAALAYAASRRGIPCVVVMPRDAPPVKARAVAGYGAEIVTCERDERAAVCERLRAERGMTLIHPFEHPDVIAGQGTAALELIEEIPGLDLLVAPIGGGGLMSGTTLVAAARLPRATLLASEPETADDAFRSLESGVRQPGLPNPVSCADGLLTGIGERAFAILSTHGVRVVTVDEGAIRQAARDVAATMKLVVEPSGATVLAALRARRETIAGLRVGAIFSGGNVELSGLVG